MPRFSLIIGEVPDRRLRKRGFLLRDLESRAGRLYVLHMRREVEIVNKLGLHARPAARFVRWVNRFKSTITIWKGEEKFSAASLLEVLTVAGLREVWLDLSDS